jgi:hypothetical protein
MSVDEQSQAGLELRAGELYAGRYRIVMQIGKGGMGRVYLAEDIRLGGKAVALKLTRPLPDERRSFLPEAQMLSQLDHPHLPSIVDYYPPTNEGVACLVMDYIAGDTLAERLERNGMSLPFTLVLSIIINLCGVLVYLHEQNPPIVFRDLKPSNVLLDRNNQAILVDFGIARWHRAEMENDTLQLGTPGFAAPEQLRGGQSDARTDLYGLGALAYHLLSGGQFAIRHRGQLNRVVQGDVPHVFTLLLGQLLADAPEDRPQSASALNVELLKIQEEQEGVGVVVDIGNEIFGSSRANRRHNGSGVFVAAIASAYPGAGATFATLALSSSLSRAGITHAIVECPGAEPELYPLLDGSRKMPRGAVYAAANGLQAAVPAWRIGKAAIYAADPNRNIGERPGGEFAGWLRRLGVPVVLLDVSSRWEDQEMKMWLLRSADRIWMVGDCYPAKWSSRRQLACLELQEGAKQHHVKMGWLANRDQPFHDRKQWLSLFPSRPEAVIPNLPSQAMLNALWRGGGLPSDQHTAGMMDAAFQRLIDSFIKQR